jgi:hypothetical protein
MDPLFPIPLLDLSPEDIQLIMDALRIREYIARCGAQLAEEHSELAEVRQSHRTAHHCKKLIQELEAKASICWPNKIITRYESKKEYS